MGSRVRRAAWLYRRHLGARVRSISTYRGDLWIMVGASALTQATGLIFLWAIFSAIPSIHGWTVWQAVLMYAMVYFTEGVCSVFFNGVWDLSGLINRGELDRMLVRPYSVVGQVMSGSIGMNGLGNMTLATAMFAVSLSHLDVMWSVPRAALGLVLLVGAVGVKLGLNLLSNATAFWIGGPFSVLAVSIHQTGELARFPLTIYSPAIQGLLTFVLPFAFISYFPVSTMLGIGAPGWVGCLTPLVAVATIGAGVGLIRRGLRRYESAGN